MARFVLLPKPLKDPKNRSAALKAVWANISNRTNNAADGLGSIANCTDNYHNIPFGIADGTADTADGTDNVADGAVGFADRTVDLAN
ncbi:MAG: hypothetical protein K9G46_07300 [Flavobacteriales bacterium]|nr:hypothetical protein [Flavobacteriales bacterium]